MNLNKQYPFKKEDLYRHIVDERTLKLSKWTENNSITLSMIVKDEEKYLETILEDTYEHVDEIILVDTGSSDSTKKIASEYTDKIYDFPGIGNFADWRNFAKSKSTGNWILRLDADESMQPYIFTILYDLIQDSTLDAVMFPIKNYQEDPKKVSNARWELSETIRLFRNVPEFVFDGVVHEDIVGSIDEISKIRDVVILRLDHFIDHYGYLKPQEEKEAKFKWYADLCLKQIAESPGDWRPYFNFAVHLFHNDRIDEAEKYYKLALERNNKLWLAYNDVGVIKLRKSLDKDLLDESQRYFQLALSTSQSANKIHKQKIFNNLANVNSIRRVVGVTPKA